MDQDVCCGLAAAFVSIVAFGSFAAPVKCQAARKVDVDPLVLQTYKVGVCFATSWLALCFVRFRLSPYGLVSGLLMVPGGTAGYFGVRNAGLAVSQGIWSALKVLVAFAWGLFMFHEPVKSIAGTTIAIACLLVGLVGMSYFAAQEDADEGVRVDDSPSLAQEPLLPRNESDTLHPTFPTSYWGMSLRAWGIMGAVIDGLYGGSVLVPMHFAKYHGLDYLLSFAVGCWTVIVLVWLSRWMMYAVQTKSLHAGWKALPSPHFSTIGPYAILAGLIWSVGNVSSLLSVAWLGQGLGYSLVQSQLIVAGLWAVCFYREIHGRVRIGGWFVFCMLTVVSILLLTRQHQSLPVQDDTATASAFAERGELSVIVKFPQWAVL